MRGYFLGGNFLPVGIAVAGTGTSDGAAAVVGDAGISGFVRTVGIGHALGSERSAGSEYADGLDSGIFDGQGSVTSRQVLLSVEESGVDVSRSSEV